MTADLFSASILLLLVLDPFGNLPIVVSATSRVPPERRVPIVLRECLVAYVLLIAFLAGGRTFMQWLQLSDVSLGELSAVGALMGRLIGGSLLIQGLIARLMYTSLYKMHQVSIHGIFRVAFDTLGRLLRERLEPRVKLH